MYNAVQDFTLNLLPSRRKNSQSGWVSVNAVCCHHNGHNQDTRGRGGIKTNPNGGISWHCFNCGYKTSYTPGRTLSFKYRKLLGWLGANQNDIQRLVVESMRLKNTINSEASALETEEVTFEQRSLPANAQSFEEYAMSSHAHEADSNFIKVVEYIASRNIDIGKYKFYWANSVEHKLSYRVIVPFYYKNQIYGYTARAIESAIQPKYYSDHPGHFVFNLDNQASDNKFVIVCEGPFDAMSIDGVSTQTNDISESQADIIEALDKRVIVVPDFDPKFDKRGKWRWDGAQMIKRALEYGWSVSFPVWHTECKDINEAVCKYGKLFTLKSILDGVESNPIKIQIKANKIR